MKRSSPRASWRLRRLDVPGYPGHPRLWLRRAADIGAAVAQIEGFEGLSGTITYAGTNGIPPKAVPINQIVDGVDTLVATIGG